jgi:hypothetical protein
LGNVDSENDDAGKSLAVVDMEACKFTTDDTQDSTSSNVSRLANCFLKEEIHKEGLIRTKMNSYQSLLQDKGEIGASDEFVYDLYYANFPDVDDSLIDKFIRY